MTNLAQNTEINNTTQNANNPRIFLTDYASYNNGTQFEFGHWVDLTDLTDASELMEYISNHFEEADKKSPLDSPREEIMITDFENFPKNLYSESMNEDDFEQVYKYIEIDYDNLSDDEKVSLWNEMCSDENRSDDEIFVNDEEFFEMFFANDVIKAVQATQYGKYNYSDDYVQFNGYGNLDSFNNPMDVIDEQELINWLMENK